MAGYYACGAFILFVLWNTVQIGQSVHSTGLICLSKLQTRVSGWLYLMRFLQ